jgi:hypothetical protein
MYVTFTGTVSEPVADKTFDEVDTAYNNGTLIVFVDKISRMPGSGIATSYEESIMEGDTIVGYQASNTWLGDTKANTVIVGYAHAPNAEPTVFYQALAD